MSNSRLLEAEGISKIFPGVKALSDVRLELESGEVHALLGANGAGKTTLIKIIAGAYPPSAGSIALKGKEVRLRNPHDAREMGIAVIHQELSVFPELSVAENVLIGRMPRRKGCIDWKKAYEDSQAIMDEMGVKVNVRNLVRDLSIAERQMVEIGRAVYQNASVFVMDEPSSSLSSEQVAKLFELIRKLKSRKSGILYITHRLEEVMQIADRVTILRDGKYVGTWGIAEIDLPTIISQMVGKDVIKVSSNRPGAGQAEKNPTLLDVKRLSRKGVLEDIAFSIRRGEIVGIAGLVGAGKTELCRALFGLMQLDECELLFDGRIRRFVDPRQAIGAGIGLVPENRKEQGLILCLSVKDNISAAFLNIHKGRLFIDQSRENAIARESVSQLRIVVTSILQVVKNLSGGNQQKVVLGRWLAIRPKLLIVDEPTRGIDVGAKAQVHSILREMASNGVSILMSSSENEELLLHTDRILVMREGRIVREVNSKETTDDQLLYYESGGTREL